MRVLSHQKNWKLKPESSLNKENLKRKLSLNDTNQSKNTNEIELNEINDVKRLKQLFLIYSKNEKSINSQKFGKMIIDSKIINSSSLSKPIVDILFHKETRSSAFMSFENFCNVLISIVKILYPNENESKGLSMLFMRNLFPLLNNVTSTNQNDYFEKKLEMLQTDKNLKNLLKNNFYLFIRIYEKYYSWEFSNIINTKKNELSEKSYLKFLRDFELCPYLVSKNKAVEIYENINNNKNLILKSFLNDYFPKNLGSSFTIYSFVLSLFLISLNSYNNDFESASNDFSNLTLNIECFKLLVDKLYTCPAINVVLTAKQSMDLKSMNRENVDRLVKHKVFNKKMSTSVENLFSTINHDFNNTSPIKNHNKSISLSELNLNHIYENDIEIYDITNNKGLDEFDLEKKFLSKYKKVLIQAYKYYANLLDSSNYIFLNFTAFLRMVKDMGLIDNYDSSLSLNINNMDSIDKKNTFGKKNNSLNKGLQLISYNELNLLFSKFSCEIENNDEHPYKNKINYLFYKKNLSSIKTNTSQHFEKLKANTNKRINFQEFLKILICLSNKLFNPSNKQLFNSTNSLNFSQTFKLNSLLEIDSMLLHDYLEKFIIQYIFPIYNNIKFNIENQEEEIKMLKKSYIDTNFVSIVLN